jgi:hypothetical protein
MGAVKDRTALKGLRRTAVATRYSDGDSAKFTTSVLESFRPSAAQDRGNSAEGKL